MRGRIETEQVGSLFGGLAVGEADVSFDREVLRRDGGKPIKL